MKTWEDYKEYVKKTDSKRAMDMKESEELAEIITAMIAQRNALGLTQRQLAQMCGIPQSSLARIESCKSIPNLKTLLNILKHLNLSLKIQSI